MTNQYDKMDGTTFLMAIAMAFGAEIKDDASPGRGIKAPIGFGDAMQNVVGAPQETTGPAAVQSFQWLDMPVADTPTAAELIGRATILRDIAQCVLERKRPFQTMHVRRWPEVIPIGQAFEPPKAFALQARLSLVFGPMS